jgi:ABC-2 type transport system permease protein
VSPRPEPAAWKRGALAWLAQHLAIAREFVHIGIVRKAQFRLEFVNQVVMDCFFYATHVLSFEFLFLHVDTIAGWTQSEVRVFLGLVFASDAFMMVWHGQSWMLGEDLKKGNLDSVRVRPAWSVFVYMFQRFSLEGLANMSIALGYFGYACARSDVAPTLDMAWRIALAVLLCWWGRTILVVLFSITEFHFVNADLARLLHNVFSEVTDRPLDVFGARMRQFFVYVLPVGALAHVPASIVLGRIGALEALAVAAFYALLGLGVFRWWKRSFRRYESAMS